MCAYTMDNEERYRIPARRHRTEEEIKRSRFITTVARTETPEVARDFIREMKEEFADASHNCWAYVAGPPGSTAQIGMSDDSEPHGTAGRPMLTVLLHSEIGEICAVVTRYFGGTLLGKGGLVKAYSGGVKAAVESLPTMEKIPTSDLLVMIDYASVTPFQLLLPEFEATVVKEEYAVDASFTVRLPSQNIKHFKETLTNLTNGNAIIDHRGES